MRVLLVGVALVALSSRHSLSPLPRPADPAQATTATAPPSDAEMERFLHDAKVIKTKSIGTGVTGSLARP